MKYLYEFNESEDIENSILDVFNDIVDSEDCSLSIHKKASYFTLEVILNRRLWRNQAVEFIDQKLYPLIELAQSIVGVDVVDKRVNTQFIHRGVCMIREESVGRSPSKTILSLNLKPQISA